MILLFCLDWREGKQEIQLWEERKEMMKAAQDPLTREYGIVLYQSHHDQILCWCCQRARFAGDLYSLRWIFSHYCTWQKCFQIVLQRKNHLHVTFHQGSHSTWKTWKTWKNESTLGKPGIIMEALKKLINIMEKWYETWKNLVVTKNSPLTPLKPYKIH